MASPLSFFRRHSKVLLAILTAITVVTFTVGGVVLQFFQGHAPAGTVDSNAVVATWEGGSITEGELNRAKRRREVVGAVLAQIDRLRMERSTDSVPKAPQLLLGTSDQQMVIDEIMAERAEDLGIRVTDADVNAYLALYSDQLVAPEEISENFRKYAGSEMQSSDFFDRMKKELAILQMYLAYQSASPAVTPAAAWEAYLRSSRPVQATVVPFPVADYVDEVQDPSSGDVKKYYERYKTRYGDPISGEVGFRRPFEAKFGYFHADFDDFIERAKAQVTEEQVRQAYDEAVARGEFRQLELPSVDEPAPGETTPPVTETPPGETPLPPAEEAPAPEGTAPADPATETPAPEGTTPEGTTPESPAPESPTPESPAPESDSVEETTPPADPPEENAAIATGDERLFVVLQEEGEAGQPATSDGEAPATEQPTAEQPAGEPSETETPADGEASAGAPPSGAVIVGSPDLAATPPAPPGADAASPEAPADPGAPAAPKFKPFEEVADELRLRLARPLAQQAMLDAVQEASVVVDDYALRLNAADIDGVAAPARPNFRNVASKLGLTYAETPMINAFATRTAEGKPYYGLLNVREMDYMQQMMGGQQFKTFAQTGFNPAIPLFEPTTLFSPYRLAPQDAYVFWKTEQKVAEVPPLEEIRDEVVQAWKMEKARDLARDAAAKAAEEASAKAANAKPDAEGNRASVLAEIYPKKAKSAGEFTFAPHQFDPTAGEIQNVENPGPELRQAIFALRAGEVGFGPNADKSEYYVVEVTKDLQPPAETVDRFLAMPQQFLMQLISPSLMAERQNFQYEVFREMTEQVDLQWKRPPAEERRG